GLATGSTMAAALQEVRAAQPSRLIAAVPVASVQGIARIEPFADQVVAVLVEADFGSVGYWYRDFGQTSDDEVIACLTRGY
ncbi:MAG: phosphoribosyltransferase, partial [Candidatus Nanopelagicales bacterium]